MGVRSGTIAARFFCGLSLLLLSAAQQKAFALPAAPPVVEDATSREPSKKKKTPLTLQQTLPDAYASRAAGTSAVQSAVLGDGRFPPLDPTGWLVASEPAFSGLASAGVQTVVRASPSGPDIPCLRSFHVCVLRTGPPRSARAA